MVTPYRFYKHPEESMSPKQEPLLEKSAQKTTKKITASTAISLSWDWIRKTFSFSPKKPVSKFEDFYDSLGDSNS